MKRATWSTAFYVLLVFLSGAAVGGFAHRLYLSPVVQSNVPPVPKPDEWRSKYLDEMGTRLSLSKEQTTQLNAILDATGDRVREVKTKYDREARAKRRPEMKVIQEDQVRKINEILSETQRVEYAKLRVEREQRRQKDNAAKPKGN